MKFLDQGGDHLMLFVAYAGLCIASILGLVLFVGFTFRVKVRYPLQIVSIHWVVAAVTFVVLIVWTIQKLAHRMPTGDPFLKTWLVVSDSLYFVTLLTGLLFFWTHDAKRKPLRLGLVSTHLVMACLTFISVTSLLPLSIPKSNIKNVYSTGRWALLHRNQTIQARFNHYKPLTQVPQK